MVPEAAVLSGEDSSYVYVNRSGKAAQVKVTTGVKQNGLIEIKGQLNDGDDVVTEGNLQISDGVKVSTAAATPVPVKTGK
jgi:multidrug efflux pump subunit AcrA (membrane-fusion protein)